MGQRFFAYAFPDGLFGASGDVFDEGVIKGLFSEETFPFVSLDQVLIAKSCLAGNIHQAPAPLPEKVNGLGLFFDFFRLVSWDHWLCLIRRILN